MRLKKGFSITNIIGLLLGLLSVSAIVGAYYFIHQSRDNGFEENIKTLNRLQQLNAEWTTSILKTRSYTLQHFDQLAFYMTQIREGLATLDQQGMLDTKQVGAETVKQYQIYKHSFKAKNQFVEGYKSEQAILRNSVRYLPQVISELQQLSITKNKTKDNNKGKAKNNREIRALNDKVGELALLVNQFLLSTIGKEKVQAVLTELSLQPLEEGSAIKSKIQSYIIHTELILKHKPEVNKRLEGALSKDIGSLSANVIDAYTKTQNVTKQHIKRLQEIMLAGGVMLLAVMLWFLFRLRHSNQQLTTTDANPVTSNAVSSQPAGPMGESALKAERSHATGHLVASTFKKLQTTLPALKQHIVFLDSIKTDQSFAQHANQLNALSLDMANFQHDLSTINMLVDPQANDSKKVDFDFNDVIQQAFDMASFEAGTSITFTQQLSEIPVIQASPLDVFQIALKLFRQAAKSSEVHDRSVFVKTWATGRYANMYITLADHDDIDTLYAKQGLAIVRDLVEQNKGELKLISEEGDSHGMLWLLFPYFQ